MRVGSQLAQKNGGLLSYFGATATKIRLLWSGCQGLILGELQKVKGESPWEMIAGGHVFFFYEEHSLDTLKTRC